MSFGNKQHIQIGELAKRVGKTARALHLYEELGLLRPAGRSPGGFRLYDIDSLERVEWILRLQRSGFSLAEIQGFVRNFESAQSGPAATDEIREIFQAKLAELRKQAEALHASERDLEAAVHYLDACEGCAPSVVPAECRSCNQNGHEPENVPSLFAGLSEQATTGSNGNSNGYDVDVTSLRNQRGQTEPERAPDQEDNHGV